MSLTRDILETLQTALADDLGAIDLTGRVLIGLYEKPPGNGAYAAIVPTPITDTEGHSLREWGVAGGVAIAVWAPAAGSTPEARMLAAIDAADAVAARLWQTIVGSPVAPFATGPVTDPRLSVAMYDGAEFSQMWGAWGVVQATLSYNLLPTSGGI